MIGCLQKDSKRIGIDRHPQKRQEPPLKMVLSVLLKFIYPPPPSVVITAVSVISFVSLSKAGWMEINGKHLKYSKLWNDNNKKGKIPSKMGMLILYTPAFVLGFTSFLVIPEVDFRFNLLRTALTTHFFKRIFEVLFVHKYSGWMDIEDTVSICLAYSLSSATMIYTQYLTQEFSEPNITLEYVGIPMFLLGICGNFYHHYLLSQLRSEGDNQYKIPRGGLFTFVICPHYLFEIIGFLGISCISQTLYAFSFTLGTMFYLMGRSYATKKWYESKFDDFPKAVRALIPYIF